MRDFQIYSLYLALVTLAKRLGMDLPQLLSTSVTLKSGYFDGYEMLPNQLKDGVNKAAEKLLSIFEEIWNSYKFAIPV